jgi:small subunit ribosomal protein S6
MNRYDGLYILDVQDKGGKDDPIKTALDGIEKEINTLGGHVHGTQKMDRRRFERIADDVDSGFYVNVQFSIEGDKLAPLQAKLKLSKGVFRQFYLKAKPEVAAA